MRIDSHQHFWCFTEEDYGWIDENQHILRQDFLPEQLAEVLANNNLEGSVAVQARQSLEETKWLIGLAQQHECVKGVVGWIDLKANDLNQQLLPFADVDVLKGFRHVIQDEADPEFMLNPRFIRGLHCLAEHGYRYDLLIFAHQLPQALALIEQVPQLKIVIDHIAKPAISSGEGFKEWQTLMEQIALYPNVYCKVSGMVTEADVNAWQTSDFTPYLEVVFAAFGTQRIMYGSDWPVCLLAGNYQSIQQIMVDYVQENCAHAFDDIFGQNAVTFYQL